MSEHVVTAIVAGLFVFGMLVMPKLFVMYLIHEMRRMAEMMPEERRER